MRKADLEKRVGEVVILDLVSGAQVTTVLKELTIDGYAIVGKLMLFQVVPEPRNPMQQPHPEANPIPAATGRRMIFPAHRAGR